MKFLLECVICYRGDSTCPPDSAVVDPSVPQPQELFSAATPPSRASLVDSGSDRIQRKKVSRSAKGGGPEWKPTLHGICENTTNSLRTPAARAKTEQDRKADNSRRKSGGSKRCAAVPTPVIRQSGGRRSDYYGHQPVQMIVPVISPTPFMF